jgi:hypothetical protein
MEGMARTVHNDRKKFEAIVRRAEAQGEFAHLQAVYWAAEGDHGAVIALLALRELRSWCDELEQEAVARARGERLGWRLIGEALGAGKTALWEKYRASEAESQAGVG